MSHMASLRSASFRALRSGSAVAVVSRCTANARRLDDFEQHASFTTLSTSPQRTSVTDNSNNTFRKRAISERTIPIDSLHAEAYAISRCLHTSPILFDSVNVTTPPFPESVKEGTIRLLKKVGDKVSADETIAEIETDKASLQVNVIKAGVIEQFLVADGDNVISGAQIAKLNTSGDFKPSANQQVTTPQPEKSDTAATQAKPEQSKQTPPKGSSTPMTSFELSPPTGSERDTSGPQRPHPHLPPPPTQFTGYDPSKMSAADPNKITGTRSETRVKMSRMRLKIAERLKDAQNTCAMLTTFNEIDMSNLVEFRKKYVDQFQKRHNIKLGYMSAFVKAAACALVDNPIVNAVIDGTDIVYRDYVDISVAVAAPKGLVVPVLRNVEKMNFADIERTINDFGQKAKAGTLAIEDMDGGTFTISNGGVFGSLFGTPIINLPQSAILGMHGIFDRPVAVNGKIEIHPMMYVALTYDHRILDGRDAVLFLRKIKQYVEDSRSIFLSL